MQSDLRTPKAPQPSVGASYQAPEGQIQERYAQIAELELKLKRAAEQLKTSHPGDRSSGHKPKQAACTLRPRLTPQTTCSQTMTRMLNSMQQEITQSAAQHSPILIISMLAMTSQSTPRRDLMPQMTQCTEKDTQSICQHYMKQLIIQRAARDTQSSPNTGHNMSPTLVTT
jgi:hypothetical protein